MINFFDERHNWFLWVPVLFGIGICSYFALPKEPSIWVGINALVFSSSLLIATRKQPFFFLIILTFFIIVAGFANANWRAIRQASPVIPKLEEPVSIIGTVTEVEHLPSGKRIFVTPKKIRNVSPEDTPKRIRLTVRTEDNGAKPGDLVSIFGMLSPPPIPVYPGAYDFARISYFNQIGAIGYSLAPIRILETGDAHSFSTLLATIRKTIADRILEDIGKENGSIAAALLVGESGAISKDVYKDIRAAGLAHLLAISGLHLSLVVGIFYLFSRRLFALSETLTLHFNIKKWAAICGLFGSLSYLFLAGMPIPAQRASIMAGMVLLAILIDRNPTPMRCVAWAALIILVFEPESILSPSFQMSFAAVIALISGYRALAALMRYWGESLPEHTRSMYAKLGLYVYGIIASTVIAGLATLPFSIYHFNNYSAYSILANLVAIPATTFWIMPWGVLALLLFPLHLENLALVPMQWGIGLVIDTAQYIASMPHASSMVPTMPPVALGIVALGMCWLLLWEKKWRLAGIPFIIAGMATIFFTPTPDMVIDQKGKLYAVKNQKKELVFNNNRLAHFTRHIWMQRSGQEKTIPLSERTGLDCDSSQCDFETRHTRVSFIHDPTLLSQACKNADIVVNLTYLPKGCWNGSYAITRKELIEKGTHAIWIEDKQHVKVKTVGDMRGERLWVMSE